MRYSPLEVRGMRVFLLFPVVAGCHIFENPTVECVAGKPCARQDTDTPVTNQPPSAPGVSISPAAPEDGDDLVVNIDTPSVDPEGVAVTYRYVWSQNGTQLGTTKDTIPAAKTGPGDTFEVQVFASDGSRESSAGTASVTVSDKPNTPPVINSVMISPTKPQENDVLELTVDATDADGDSLTYSYVWYRDGMEATEVGDRPGVDPRYHVPGEHWYVVVTASDGRESVSAQSNTVEVWGTSSFYRVNHEITGMTDANRSSFTGQWRFSFYSEGIALGHLDCKAIYDITSVRSKACSSCTYDFTVKIRQNAASELGPGCDSLAADGTGEVLATYNTYFSLTNNNIALDLLLTNPAYGNYDYAVAYTLAPAVTTPTFSYDSYRNLNVVMKSYYYASFDF